MCLKFLTIMPVLRDLYSESKKSTSAYLPTYSLSIAAQSLSHHPRRNNLHNTLLRVTMQPTATRNASRPAPKWLDYDANNMVGKVVAMPARDDIDLPVEEHLIVELYSK